MPDLDLFSIGEQWDWDRYINLQLGHNYFEQVAKECFEKEYNKVTHHKGIENLYRHIPNNDIAIRFDNCFAPVNLETIFNSDILQIIERTVLQGHEVLLYTPTEPFTKQDLRACSKYLRNNVRNKIHYANCNPNIFNYSNFDMKLHYIDYFSVWSVTGNIHWTSQVNYKKDSKDFLALAFTVRPGKKIMLDALKENGLYNKGYITDSDNIIDNLDDSKGRYNIRSMTDEYEKHPNFMNITPWTKAVHFELVIEDTESNVPLYASEKIYRAMYNKMPFIVHGKKGYLQLLKDLGYKTFDTIFDESYDELGNREDKAMLIAKEISNFCNLEQAKKQDLIKSVNDIVEHNYEILTNPNNVGKLFHNPINSR